MSAEYPVFSINTAPKVIPVVLPPSADLSLSGRIRNISVRGTDHSGWLTYAGPHGWVLKREKELEGYSMLEDMYKAEGNAEGWEAYKRYLKDWRDGRTGRPFPFHLLPKEVQARQQGQIAPEYQDPWNLPPPPATTGVLAEPKKAKGA